MHAAFRAAGAGAAPRRARHSSLLEEVARARAGATAREFAEERNQQKLHASVAGLLQAGKAYHSSLLEEDARARRDSQDRATAGAAAEERMQTKLYGSLA